MRGIKRFAKRLGAQCGKGGPLVKRGFHHQIDRTEPARIAQRKSVAAFGFEHEVIVGAQGVGIGPPASAHAQMKHHGLAAIGVDQTIFGAAPQPRYRSAG